MRVLLPLHGFVRWNGGLDLIRLMSAALSHPEMRDLVELHFALPRTTLNQRLISSLRRWKSLGIGSRKLATSGSRNSLLRSAHEIARAGTLHRCIDSMNGALSAARSAHADAIFPSMMPLEASPVPWVGYIFDFQHVHMPQFFSKEERNRRDSEFARLARESNGIVVNSKFVAREVHRLLGVPQGNILALPFAPYSQPNAFDLQPAEIRSRYGIGERYVMVCNHFWMHKDHATAFRAFSYLIGCAGNADLELVLTGDPIDHRDPFHYERVLELARSLGIAARTHFLGLIPKHEQLTLLRGSEALIQPTLYEGGPGGGSLYDAIGLGVPAVVSDIPINLEIDTGDVAFFRAGNAEDLAEKLQTMLGRERSNHSQDDLLSAGHAKLLTLGKAIREYLCGLS